MLAGGKIKRIRLNRLARAAFCQNTVIILYFGLLGGQVIAVPVGFKAFLRVLPNSREGKALCLFKRRFAVRF